jgi:hypothetical protein
MRLICILDMGAGPHSRHAGFSARALVAGRGWPWAACVRGAFVKSTPAVGYSGRRRTMGSVPAFRSPRTFRRPTTTSSTLSGGARSMVHLRFRGRRRQPADGNGDGGLQPERMFVTSPLQPGLDYIHRHRQARRRELRFHQIRSHRIFSGAGWWLFLRRSELDAPPGAARRGARVTMYGGLWQFAGESALIGVAGPIALARRLPQ